ncbi:MAG: ion channel [Cyclobacteriaceae bacterium]|jgi:hypothetical protein
MTTKVQSSYFFFELVKRLSPAYLLVGAIVVVYVYLMQFVDHSIGLVPYAVVFFALFKSLFFTFVTFRQINNSIQECHSFGRLLWVFSMLVFLIIFSFATDFTCLSAANTDSFQGRNIIVNDEGLSESLFKYFYFSIVTFASVGYGDIVPITIFSRLLVILEIIQSFVLIVFGLSNINHIHTTVKTSIAK